MASFAFPAGYGYVFAGLLGTQLANLFCVINVSRYRRRFGIRYPTLYADASHVDGKQCKEEDVQTFNCAQRAHQNTLESLGSVQLQGALVGLRYPVFAAACLALYAVGRVLYCIGYTRDGPSGRLIGGVVSHLGDLPLLVGTGYCAYALGMD